MKYETMYQQVHRIEYSIHQAENITKSNRAIQQLRCLWLLAMSQTLHQLKHRYRRCFRLLTKVTRIEHSICHTENIKESERYLQQLRRRPKLLKLCETLHQLKYKLRCSRLLKRCETLNSSHQAKNNMKSEKVFQQLR